MPGGGGEGRVFINAERVRQPHRIPQASVGPAEAKQFPSTWNSMTQVQTLDEITQRPETQCGARKQ